MKNNYLVNIFYTTLLFFCTSLLIISFLYYFYTSLFYLTIILFFNKFDFESWLFYFLIYVFPSLILAYIMAIPFAKSIAKRLSYSFLKVIFAFLLQFIILWLILYGITNYFDYGLRFLTIDTDCIGQKCDMRREIFIGDPRFIVYAIYIFAIITSFISLNLSYILSTKILKATTISGKSKSKRPN